MIEIINETGLEKIRTTDSELYTLIYQQDVPMIFMELFHYNAGNKELKKVGDEIKVNRAEKTYLMKLRNGHNKKGGKLIFKLKEV